MTDYLLLVNQLGSGSILKASLSKEKCGNPVVAFTHLTGTRKSVLSGKVMFTRACMLIMEGLLLSLLSWLTIRRNHFDKSVNF